MSVNIILRIKCGQGYLVFCAYTCRKQDKIEHYTEKSYTENMQMLVNLQFTWSLDKYDANILLSAGLPLLVFSHYQCMNKIKLPRHMWVHYDVNLSATLVHSENAIGTILVSQGPAWWSPENRSQWMQWPLQWITFCLLHAGQFKICKALVDDSTYRIICWESYAYPGKYVYIYTYIHTLDNSINSVETIICKMKKYNACLFTIIIAIIMQAMYKWRKHATISCEGNYWFSTLHSFMCMINLMIYRIYKPKALERCPGHSFCKL